MKKMGEMKEMKKMKEKGRDILFQESVERVLSCYRVSKWNLLNNLIIYK